MKRFIALLLIVTTLFMTLAFDASAARVEEYVSEVALVYENSVEDARKAIEGTDWKLFEQDLNPKADYWYDDGVYLIYKTSTNVEDAITDLRVMDMYGGYKVSDYKKQLEETRKEYLAMIADLRVAADEFKTLYESGDEMAALAYRQMNYYKDVKSGNEGTETDMLMGEFFLNMPSDNQIVQVLLEGNSMIVGNLISLLAIGISGATDNTLATRVAEKYAIKDSLTDTDYYSDAESLAEEFETIRAKLLRYDDLSEKYDLESDEMTEEEFSFVCEYIGIAEFTKSITMGDTNFAEFIKGDWKIKDLYPIIAALTPGQKALVGMGQLETVLKYNAPSKPIADLLATLEAEEEKFKDEDGNMPTFDVYAGVDREIFKGNFAMTTEAERQKAATGKTWGLTDSFILSPGQLCGLVYGLAFEGTLALKTYLLVSEGVKLKWAADTFKTNVYHQTAWEIFSGKYSASFLTGLKVASVALALIVVGSYVVMIWYNYYNPKYLDIPSTLIDVKETDLGDKYVKYTAAKVFEKGEEGEVGKLSSDKAADFNAYQGKEWIALYYTKDASAGKCLLPNFVYSENNSSVARRHQAVAMFGESNAFNLNSHVYAEDAPGVYLTVRYSTAKKAAADMPAVVGSIASSGAFYTMTAIAGVGLGVGGTLCIQNFRKKKEDEIGSEGSEETLEPIDPPTDEEKEETVESAEIVENAETVENQEIVENVEAVVAEEAAEVSESTEESAE